MFNLEFIRKVDPGEGENFKKLKSWEYIRRKHRKERSERKTEPLEMPVAR